jgi:hypothetical protein
MYGPYALLTMCPIADRRTVSRGDKGYPSHLQLIQDAPLSVDIEPLRHLAFYTPFGVGVRNQGVPIVFTSVKTTALPGDICMPNIICFGPL